MTTKTEKQWLFGTERECHSLDVSKQLIVEEGLLKSKSQSPVPHLRPIGQHPHQSKAAAKLKELLALRAHPVGTKKRSQQCKKETVVAGRKVYHPHLDIMKARLALSPYMTKPQYDYCWETLNLLDFTSMERENLGERPEYTGDLPAYVIDKKFKEVVTFQPKIHRTDYTQTKVPIQQLEKYKEIPEKYIRSTKSASKRKPTRIKTRPQSAKELEAHSLMYSEVSNSPKQTIGISHWNGDSNAEMNASRIDEQVNNFGEVVHAHGERNQQKELDASLKQDQEEVIDGLLELLNLEESLDAIMWQKLPSLGATVTTAGICRPSVDTAHRPKSATVSSSPIQSDGLYRKVNGWPQEIAPKATRQLLNRVV